MTMITTRRNILLSALALANVAAAKAIAPPDGGYTLEHAVSTLLPAALAASKGEMKDAWIFIELLTPEVAQGHILQVAVDGSGRTDILYYPQCTPKLLAMRIHSSPGATVYRTINSMGNLDPNGGLYDSDRPLKTDNIWCRNKLRPWTEGEELLYLHWAQQHRPKFVLSEEELAKLAL